MLEQIKSYIDGLSVDSIYATRQRELVSLAEIIKKEKDQNGAVNLNFICTHNSRRSQFAQTWAQTIAAYVGFSVDCYSGGVEVTECNLRTINALQTTGFEVTQVGEQNPRYQLRFSDDSEQVTLFSKLHSDNSNPDRFLAIMTCDHADQNCPFIPNAVARFSLTYVDPKRSDGTSSESETYLNTSALIATEMKFLFSQLQ